MDHLFWQSATDILCIKIRKCYFELEYLVQGRTNLPPLNAIKAFESSARNGSFALAAQELGVTPAAVSQLVHKLETVLGKTLFTRFNNRIVLTDAGTAVFTGVSPALRDIADTVQRVTHGPSRRRLVVSVLPSVAECWLVPLMETFTLSHPHVALDLRVENDPVDLAQAGIDVRIAYGRQPSADLVQTELLRDDVLPLCSPTFLKKRGGAVVFDLSLADALIHIQWGAAYASNPTWRDWLAAYAPNVRMDLTRGHQVDASRFALQLARMGLGLALGHRWLARHDLSSGALVVAADDSLPLGQNHYIGIPPTKLRHRDVVAFRDWVLAAAVNPLA